MGETCPGAGFICAGECIRGSDIDHLSDKGLNVILDKSPHHMHHKFMLVDERILLNGSFNWTCSASELNEENITISTDVELVSLFTREFAQLTQKLTAL